MPSFEALLAALYQRAQPQAEIVEQIISKFFVNPGEMLLSNTPTISIEPHEFLLDSCSLSNSSDIKEVVQRVHRIYSEVSALIIPPDQMIADFTGARGNERRLWYWRRFRRIANSNTFVKDIPLLDKSNTALLYKQEITDEDHYYHDRQRLRFRVQNQLILKEGASC